MYPSLSISMIIFTYCEIPTNPPLHNSKKEYQNEGQTAWEQTVVFHNMKQQLLPMLQICSHNHHINRNCLKIGMQYVTSEVAFFWDMSQKMESAYSSKILVPVSRATQRHIPQESNLPECDNLSSWRHYEQSRRLKLLCTQTVSKQQLLTGQCSTFQPLNIT